MKNKYLQFGSKNDRFLYQYSKGFPQFGQSDECSTPGKEIWYKEETAKTQKDLKALKKATSKGIPSFIVNKQNGFPFQKSKAEMLWDDPGSGLPGIVKKKEKAKEKIILAKTLQSDENKKNNEDNEDFDFLLKNRIEADVVPHTRPIGRNNAIVRWRNEINLIKNAEKKQRMLKYLDEFVVSILKENSIEQKFITSSKVSINGKSNTIFRWRENARYLIKDEKKRSDVLAYIDDTIVSLLLRRVAIKNLKNIKNGIYYLKRDAKSWVENEEKKAQLLIDINELTSK